MKIIDGPVPGEVAKPNRKKLRDMKCGQWFIDSRGEVGLCLKTFGDGHIYWAVNGLSKVLAPDNEYELLPDAVLYTGRTKP